MNENIIEIKKENIPAIPSIYYGAVGSFISKVDPFAGKIMARAIMPGGVIIAMTVNLIKDPKNKDKVIASTVLESGIIFSLSEMLPLLALTEVNVGAAALRLGVVAAPIAITIVSAVGLAILMTVVGNELYDLIYKNLENFEEFTKNIEVDIFSKEIVGKITQEEFILNELKNNKNFCKVIFPKYNRYRQKVTIGSGYNNINSIDEYFKNNPKNEMDYETLSNYIKHDSNENKAEIKITNSNNTEDFEEAAAYSRVVITENKKLKKYDIILTRRRKKQSLITTFCLKSSLSHKNIFTLTKVSFKNIFIQSLDFKQNLGFTDAFYKRVA